jgi:tetraacyldisaccharide 4'-kinase
MTLTPRAFVRVSDGERRATDGFCGTRVHAATGIGNADRFFAALAPLATIGSAHRFADHHRFVERDLDFGEPWPVIVTEKDAIKIERLDRTRLTRDIWYLEVEATFSEAAVEALRDALARHGIRVPAARAGSESRSSALAERWI